MAYACWKSPDSRPRASYGKSSSAVAAAGPNNPVQKQVSYGEDGVC